MRDGAPRLTTNNTAGGSSPLPGGEPLPGSGELQQQGKAQLRRTTLARHPVRIVTDQRPALEQLFLINSRAMRERYRSPEPKRMADHDTFLAEYPSSPSSPLDAFGPPGRAERG